MIWLSIYLQLSWDTLLRVDEDDRKDVEVDKQIYISLYSLAQTHSQSSETSEDIHIKSFFPLFRDELRPVKRVHFLFFNLNPRAD